MSDQCIFCKIAKHELNAMIVMETDDIIAFRDITPQAPVHVLVIPKKHVYSSNNLQTEDAELTGKLLLACVEVARREHIANRGYRLVINCGQEAGQSVGHLHVHVLGGREMKWPPG
jgi:histidine triad (HIT) family protein